MASALFSLVLLPVLGSVHAFVPYHDLQLQLSLRTATASRRIDAHIAFRSRVETCIRSGCDDEKSSAAAVTSTTNDSNQALPGGESTNSILLQPFLPAADPNYMNYGPVGQDDFIVSRMGGPTAEELSNENILKIVWEQDADGKPFVPATDLEVNTLIWKCFGYRFDTAAAIWTNELVFPNWKEKNPVPPDFINMRRIFSKEIDINSLRANQGLVRSVPMHAKQSLKTHLRPLGFKGYKVAELTPNKTRRAQCANWLLYYREELFGYTLEELKARRLQRQQQEEQQKAVDGTTESEEWRPPIKEVF